MAETGVFLGVLGSLLRALLMVQHVDKILSSKFTVPAGGESFRIFLHKTGFQLEILRFS